MEGVPKKSKRLSTFKLSIFNKTKHSKKLSQKKPYKINVFLFGLRMLKTYLNHTFVHWVNIFHIGLITGSFRRFGKNFKTVSPVVTIEEFLHIFAR